MILVQDVPTTDAQRELWKNRQPPTRKGVVVEVPEGDGSGFLVIDVGGEYGGVNYAARDFFTRYTWKPANESRSEADALVKSIRQQAKQEQVHGLDQGQADDLLRELRDRARKIRSGWANPQYGVCIEEETDHFLEAFEKLDTSLTAGFEHPSDWQ
jgi:hypothetical protein